MSTIVLRGQKELVLRTNDDTLDLIAALYDRRRDLNP